MQAPPASNAANPERAVPAQAVSTPHPSSDAAARHLRQQLTELEGRYEALSKRIAALDTDIGRELDSERKLVLQERRADLAVERERVLDELTEIELRLSGAQGAAAHVGTGGAAREPRARESAPHGHRDRSADGATNVPRDLMTIRIQFDRPMPSGGGSLSQRGGFGLGAKAVLDNSADPAIYTVTRDNPGLLPTNATITFTVNPDEPPGTGFVDLKGNRAEMCEFSFTTGAEPVLPDQHKSRYQAPPPHDQIEPVSADLQLLVTLAPDGKTLSYTLNSPGGDYNFLQLGSVTLQASPREVLQRTFDRLSTLARLSPEKRTPAQTQQAMRELADIGSNLYDELFPDAFKEEYRTLREKYLGGNLWLTSNEPWIPWEIVRPLAYDRRGALLYNDAPLCESFRLARWVSGTAAPARLALRRAMIVRPPANLKATSVETGYFAGLPGIVPGLAVADPVETVDETLEAFSAGETQLYHFACHGNFDLTDPNESKLKLADGFLTPSQLTADRKSGLLRARPLVFVNACHAGERGFGLTRLGGWAERFIVAGASAFVGSLWEINDDLAARFAVEFYNRFFGLGRPRAPAAGAGVP